MSIARGYTRSPMAKVMISLPDGLLARIDGEAQRRGETRSGFLRDAASRQLTRMDPHALDSELERLRKVIDKLGPFESADVIRQERDALDERDRRRL